MLCLNAQARGMTQVGASSTQPLCPSVGTEEKSASRRAQGIGPSEIATQTLLFAVFLLLCGFPHWWSHQQGSSAPPQLSLSGGTVSSEAAWPEHRKEGVPFSLEAIRTQLAERTAALTDYTVLWRG